MNRRLVRYADLQPGRTAFLDPKTPGLREKENFTIIGPGVSESADQYVHIREQHGFSIGGTRQPFGCANPQDSHDTAEVFVVHSGHWRLHFGPNKEDGALDIGPGDVASVPIRMFRGYSKLDEGKGFLWMPLGQEDPGEVTWTRAVFEAAAELKTPPMEKLRECVVRADAIAGNPASPLAGEGIEEAGVIVPRATNDRFPAGPIRGWWKHDLNLRRLTLQTGAYVPMHARSEAEVLFVQNGTVEVSWGEGALLMGAGDTLSVPVGLQHAFRNTASVAAVLFIVRGTEDPAMPVFASRPAADRAERPGP